MEAAEYPDHRIEFLPLLLLSDLFEPFFEFVVQVHRNEVGCLFVAVHKVHESLVACPLESHVLVEGPCYEIVDFCFKSQQVLGEIDGILLVLLLLSRRHDGFALFQNIWFHFLDYESDRCVDPVEHVIHQLELVEFFGFEHELASGALLVGQGFGLILDGLPEDNVDDLCFRLLLQEVVRIEFLFHQMAIDFLDVLEAGQLIEPLARFCLVELLRVLFQCSLEFGVILVQVYFSLPLRVLHVRRLQNVSLPLIAHDYVLRNGEFDQVLVHDLLLSVFANLLKNFACELAHVLLVYQFMENPQCSSGEVLLACILEIISIQVVKQLLQGEDEQSELLPLGAILLKELSGVTTLLLDLRFKHLSDEAFDPVLVNIVKLGRLILLITEPQNGGVRCDKHLGIGKPLLCLQKVEKIVQI